MAAALAAAALLGVALAVVWPPADEVAAPVTSTDDIAAGDNTLGASDDAVDTGDAATSAAAAGIDVLARPRDLVAIDDPSVVWPFGDVGDCLVQVAGLDELMPVDCGEPHDFQRFAVSELDPADVGDDAAYPAETVQTTTVDACRQRFVEFVGVAASETGLRIAITRPSARSWADGDRRFQCFLGVPDHHVVGDAEGMNG